MAYRCEIDLSPGTRSRPRSRRAGMTVTARRGGICNASYDKRSRVTANGHHIVRLEFTSAFEMLDFVQVVSDHVSRSIGMDDDAAHWISVAIRESVINAIKHGNRNDSSKRVFVEFETDAPADVPELSIRVRDQGEGFDPQEVADPLAPENLLKSSGRGIFLIRNFMDDVQLRRAPEGGMEIRMLKRVQPSGV
jgi:serine/threonine-protein kinase RsbW